MNSAIKYKEFKAAVDSFKTRFFKGLVSKQEYESIIELLLGDEPLKKENPLSGMERFEYISTPVSWSDLTRIYQVDHRTLKRYLLPIWSEVDKGRKKYFTLDQAQRIFEFLGFPEGTEI